MPELPDISVYVRALERRVVGATLQRTAMGSPFLLRTVQPPLSSLNGLLVDGVRRVGKRIVVGFAGDFWCVMHLMIAGRLHWHDVPPATKARRGLATFEFSSGTLTLTEAGTRRRASLHVLQGVEAWRTLDPGGLEVFDSDATGFAAALTRENHTLKRALTDPHLFSGVGNAYSDEILHRARLSPVALTQRLAEDEVTRLHRATRDVLEEWTRRLMHEAGDGFPERVTAFRPEMAVHGRFGQPCPVCGAKVQRIRYADNETNYCPGCQTGGRLLADRALSRLLRQDWPKTPEELEERRLRRR